MLLMTAAPTRTSDPPSGNCAIAAETTSSCLLKLSIPMLPEASTTNTMSCSTNSQGAVAVGKGLAEAEDESVGDGCGVAVNIEDAGALDVSLPMEEGDAVNVLAVEGAALETTEDDTETEGIGREEDGEAAVVDTVEEGGRTTVLLDVGAIEVTDTDVPGGATEVGAEVEDEDGERTTEDDATVTDDATEVGAAVEDEEGERTTEEDPTDTDDATEVGAAVEDESDTREEDVETDTLVELWTLEDSGGTLDAEGDTGVEEGT